MQAKCPACNTLLNIPDHLAGKPVKCQCGKVFKCSPPKKRPAVTQPAKRPAAKKSFRITCPTCNKALNVEEKLLGQMVKCPCGTKLQTKAAAPSHSSPLNPTVIPQQQETVLHKWDDKTFASELSSSGQTPASNPEKDNNSARNRSMRIWGLVFGIGGLIFYANMYWMVQIGILGNSSNVPVIHWVGASLLAMAMAMQGRIVGRREYERRESMRELRRQDPEAFKQLQDSQLQTVFSFCVVALCIALFIWIFAAGGPRTPKKTHIGISPRGPVIIQEYDD